jgi:hypothetical protein
MITRPTAVRLFVKSLISVTPAREDLAGTCADSEPRQDAPGAAYRRLIMRVFETAAAHERL